MSMELCIALLNMKRFSPDIIFNSEHLSHDLARKSIRGGMTTMAAQGVQFALQLAGTVVLARLLTPGDYGLIGMVTVVVNFAAMFKDAGLSMATVQKDQITHEQISTLFWLNVLISAFLGLCVLVCSPLVAWFYGKPELTAVTAALSLSFIITGLTIQHSALLRRHMQFGTLAVIQISSYVLNIIVTILLALLGFRYWALVGGTLATALSGTLLTLFFCPWLPGRMKKGTGVRDMLAFGGHLTGFNFINYFARNADNILIGKFIGADALGLYAKAYQLFMMPISQIRAPLNQVAMPVLSSLRNQPERYIKYYQRLIDIMASMIFPLTIYCAIEAPFLIRMLLGPQWMGVVPVFRILTIAGLIQPTFGTAGVVMLSFGYAKRQLKLGIINSFLIISSFVVGLPFGIIGVAWAYTIITYVAFIPLLFLCFRGTPVKMGLFMKAHIMPIVLSMISILPLIIRATLQSNTLSGYAISSAIFVLVYSSITFRRESVRNMLQMLLRNSQFPHIGGQIRNDK